MNDQSTFTEIDEALYQHERPFYRYCASGGGSNPADDPMWVEERIRLSELWYKLYPYST